MPAFQDQKSQYHHHHRSGVSLDNDPLKSEPENLPLTSSKLEYEEQRRLPRAISNAITSVLGYLFGPNMALFSLRSILEDVQ